MHIMHPYMKFTYESYILNPDNILHVFQTSALAVCFTLFVLDLLVTTETVHYVDQIPIYLDDKLSLCVQR